MDLGEPQPDLCIKQSPIPRPLKPVAAPPVSGHSARPLRPPQQTLNSGNTCLPEVSPATIITVSGNALLY